MAVASGPHGRTVEWLGRFERSSLTEEAAHTLGSFSALFRPTAAGQHALSQTAEKADMGSPWSAAMKSLLNWWVERECVSMCLP